MYMMVIVDFDDVEIRIIAKYFIKNLKTRKQCEEQGGTQLMWR